MSRRKTGFPWEAVVLTVILGLERLLRLGPDAIGRPRIGLVTNHTGVDRLLRPNVDLLRSAGFDVTALFSPEHGIWGGAQAGVHVEGGLDAWTGLPVHSLYGATRRPEPAVLKGLDALFIDLADIGSRYFTYPYTMAYCMEAARDAGLRVFVLDRPNPISGTAVEGNLLEPAFSSFVGLYPIPARHGLTLGELASLFNREFGIGCDLTVVPCEGWLRAMYWEETGLPFVPPSPNTTGIEMALLYAGTCLFEGTNWSEGRGTTRPFELIGAPWADGRHLAESLNRLDLPGVRFRPAFFTPTFSKHQGVECQGVQVHVLDRRSCLPVLTGLMMLEAAFRLWPAQSAFLPPWRSGELTQIDRLAGTASVRTAVEQGGSLRSLYDSWEPERQAFLRQRAPYLLYAE